MKKTMFFIFVFILAACNPSVAPTPTATVLPTETLIEVSKVNPTEAPTQTLVPTTPTLDLLHLPTSTLQPAATCPSINEKLRAKFASAFRDKKAAYHDARTVVLNFLNEGGNPQTAISKLVENNIFVSLLDLTHDGVLEFILPSGYLTVFGCQNGKYVNLLDIPPSQDAQMTAVPLAVEDLNHNGVLELFVGQVQSRDLATYQILEWNGTKFARLVTPEDQKQVTNLYVRNRVIYAVGQSNAEKGALEGNWEIADTDGNGLKDIVVRAGVYENFVNASELEDSLILIWDGKSYVVARVLREATPTPTSTATPLPYSETCSIKVPELRYQKPESSRSVHQSILDYLNAGGQPERLADFYHTTIRDLNNDAVPEVIVFHIMDLPSFTMFTCRSGKYIEEPQDREVFSLLRIMTITDNNKNGFPEVFFEGIDCIYWSCGSLYVIEWDGNHFVHKIKGFDNDRPVDYAPLEYPKADYLKDIDGDAIACW